MTPVTTPPRTAGGTRRAIAALAAGYFCGAAVALLVVAVGRLIAFAYPAGSAWLWVGIVAGTAAVVGFAVAERATATDPETLARRFAGAMLLGGFAIALVLAGLYGLPVLEPTASPGFLVVVGPVVGLLFFPVLLVAMGPRLAVGLAPDRSIPIAVAATLGVATGWALVRSPSSPLTPFYALAVATIFAEGLGFAAIWTGTLAPRHRSAAVLVFGATVSAALLLAAQFGGSGERLAIGSV